MLKDAKTQLEETYARIRTGADDVAARYERVMAQIEEALRVSKKNADMKLEIARLRAAHPPEDVGLFSSRIRIFELFLNLNRFPAPFPISRFPFPALDEYESLLPYLLITRLFPFLQSPISNLQSPIRG